MRKIIALALLGCSAILAALPVGAQSKGTAQTTAKSTAAQRKKLSITLYNQGFGLVREIRSLDIATGPVALEFADVASQIQPATVVIRATPDPAALRVLEQNYRYDLLGPGTLLDKYVGKKIKVYRWNEKRGTDEAFDAEVLSVQDGRPVLRIGGEITFDFPGRLSFPEVPPNLIAKPTLVWSLQSAKSKPDVEVTYLTQGLGWTTDYVMVVNEDDSKADLTGWVTLTNQSGTGYENAELKLVAGDVHVVTAATSTMDPMSGAEKAGSGGDAFREEGFFEYHLYTLERPATVLDKEQKQVTLLSSRGAGVKKKLRFVGDSSWFRGEISEPLENQKVSVLLEIDNSQKNGLGMALPAGVVRVYKADKGGAQQFVGEDHIDHTPRDEKITIKTGEAFDVVATRKQMDFDALGSCGSESEWEVELRNHKDVAVEVEDWETVGGDWEIVSESQKHRKENARTLVYDVTIPANGKVKLTYRARVRWC